MEQLIKKINFYGNNYEYILFKKGISGLNSIELKKIESKPFTEDCDLLIIGHHPPDFDIHNLVEQRKDRAISGSGPKSVVVISHGPYPIDGAPAPLNLATESFHFRWANDTELGHWIIKLINDHINADFYYKVQHRRFLLLVEDEINFASYFVPIIMKELELRTLSLLSEKIDQKEKDLKEKTERPVLLMASTYKQSINYLEKYGDRIVGVISALGFPKDGENDSRSGFDLIDVVKSFPHEIPVVIQSMRKQHKEKVMEKGAAFVRKDSPQLLKMLRIHLLEHFGFGEFIFRLPNESSTEIARAKTLNDLISCLEWVPIESIVYHANKKHFSNWLGVHGFLNLAEKIRPVSTPEGNKIRDLLIEFLKSAC